MVLGRADARRPLLLVLSRFLRPTRFLWLCISRRRPLLGGSGRLVLSEVWVLGIEIGVAAGASDRLVLSEGWVVLEQGMEAAVEDPPSAVGVGVV